MEQNLHLDKADETPFADASQFWRLIRRLLYIQVICTDITLAFNTLSQLVSVPRQLHYNTNVRVPRYLKATLGQGIFLPSTDDLTLKAFYDSDWLLCHLTRCSKTGYIITLGNAFVSWKKRSSQLCHDPPLNLNTVPWLLLLGKFCGYIGCYKN